MSVSLIIRRTHMYLALFMSPWVLMYALSTMAMNHKPFFHAYYGDEGSTLEKEREFIYDGSFPDGAEAKAVAAQILTSLDMYGTFNVRGNLDGTLTINRGDLTRPRRITYEAATGTVIVYARDYRTSEFLERFHRRRGYGNDRFLEDTWAFSVDLFIAGMILWAATGLWMWWELKVTRRWGTVALVGSAAAFTFFLVTI